MRIVWIIKLERSQRTAAIVAVRAPAVHGVSSYSVGHDVKLHNYKWSSIPNQCQIQTRFHTSFMRDLQEQQELPPKC